MILALAIAWFLIGLLVWYSFAYADVSWYTYWYLWDKGNYLFLFWGLCYPLDYTKYRYIFKWLAFFSATRFIWEIISLSTKINVNNLKAVAGLFILLTGTILLVLLKELLKWRKQNLRS